MSNLSGSSIGTSSNSGRATITGIPRRCMCGLGVIQLMSKSTANPYRRYYRCSYAAERKLVNDPHAFKWVDEAIINEVEMMYHQIGVLEEDVSQIKGGRNVLDGEELEKMKTKLEMEFMERMEEEFAKMKTKLEMEFIERMEEDFAKMKRNMRRLMVLVVLGMFIIVVFGLMVKEKIT